MSASRPAARQRAQQASAASSPASSASANTVIDLDASKNRQSSDRSRTGSGPHRRPAGKEYGQGILDALGNTQSRGVTATSGERRTTPCRPSIFLSRFVPALLRKVR